MAEIHARARIDGSLCGLAPEAHQTGDHDEPVVFASPGEAVTCSHCRAQIDHVRRCFAGYVAAPASGVTGTFNDQQDKQG